MLRKNMTKEERHLWYDFLSTYPIHFKKQKLLGKYVVDFYCARAKLVVELDGSQHESDDGRFFDERRTEYLEQFGIKVIRFKNIQVREKFHSVCKRIDEEVMQALSSQLK
ncbi:MAG: endonuclease domain-containing protein [Clostridia bacterium]|nr:endonuclease domain-containing protein [Clostridia bacterium]